MLKPIFKGAVERPFTPIAASANMTPSLGFTLYGDSKLSRPPVLEITRLDLGHGRSVVNSFQEDRALATWSRDEQGDFFAEAFRKGVRGRFGAERLAQQASVVAATNLLLAGVSQAVTENASGIVDGRSKFGSKEIGAEWFSEALSLGFNKTTAFINDSFNGMAHGSLQTGLEGAVEAMQAFQKHNKDRPADRYYFISNALQGATKAILDTASDHQAFTKLWVNETQDLKELWDYHRNSMVNPELLLVEPVSEIMSGEKQWYRDRHDFTGSFPVIGHWYSDPSHCKKTFDHPADARQYGFDYGPPSYRQYQAIMENLKHQETLPTPRFANQRPGFLGGTPIDLPPEQAQKRLDTLIRYGKAEDERYIHSTIELRAIITAAKRGEPVNPKYFQPQSLQLRPREHFTQTDSLEAVKREVKHYERRASDPGLSPGARAAASLRRDERQHLLDAHRHSPAAQATAVPDTVAELQAAFAGADWSKVRADYEAELNEVQMTQTPEQTDDQPTNTRLELAYRSASLKAHETVILPGAITTEQIQQISDGCFDHNQIIAHQVQLPTPLENYLEAEQIDIASEDHVLTDLADWEDGKPTPEDLHTSEPPTHGMDIETLAKTIQSIGQDGWHFVNEEERLNIPLDDLGDDPCL